MTGRTFEIIETSGRAAGQVVGFLRLDGAEPIYLPVECRAGLDNPCAGWMGLEVFRAWLGRTLTDLKVREMP